MAKLSLEDVKELLGASSLPGSPEELEVLVQWTQGVVRRKGVNYVKRYRKRLYRDWKSIRALGLSRI
jgi:hypothetical protein